MIDHASRPKISHEPISVILPLAEPVAPLEPVVASWSKNLQKLHREHEILLIRGSGLEALDETLEKLVHAYPGVHIVRIEASTSIGGCLRHGFAIARFPLVFTASGAEPRYGVDLSSFLQVIDDVDLVNGCRPEPVPAGIQRWDALWRSTKAIGFGIPSEPRPTWPGWPGWRQAQTLRWLFGLRFWDSNSPYKLVRKTLLDKIELQSASAFVHAELLAKANFLGAVMGEVMLSASGSGKARVKVPSDPAYHRDLWHLFRQPKFRDPRLACMPLATAATLESMSENERGGDQLPAPQ